MTKPRPNRLGMYADLQPILDAALATGGGTYELGTYGEAVHWRQRAYKFRKLYADTISAMSKYDAITLPRIAEGTTSVIIRVIKSRGAFVPFGDTPLLDIEDDDDLLAFAKNLGGSGG